MLVDLRTLQPNPMRDFTVDPIDPEVVETLKRSIRHHGFWGGIVCRRLPDGTIQIGAGHHRVEAAIAEGIVEADVAVYDDRDDAWMVQVYAGENATQRGGKGLAEAGSVAAAVRWLAKAIMTGMLSEIRQNHDLAKLRGNLTSERGIGRGVVADFLRDVPGIDINMINQQLANLKASGDYARIVGEMSAEVMRDPPDMEVAKTAHEAAAQASEYYGTRTFDFEGVTKHLRNSHQIEVFRKLVTGKGFKDALPVENQAPLAQHLVEVAKSHNNAEVSRRLHPREHHGASPGRADHRPEDRPEDAGATRRGGRPAQNPQVRPGHLPVLTADRRHRAQAGAADAGAPRGLHHARRAR
jgi:ParB-like nuclease domain